MFKDRLRASRIARGYTLQKTADSLGIALRSYQKYESGDSEPAFDYLIQLADLFDVPTDFLLGRDNYLKSLGVSVDVSPEGPPRHPKPQKNR
jgi:transcriptional regulator with XRE-family HTH domain